MKSPIVSVHTIVTPGQLYVSFYRADSKVVAPLHPIRGMTPSADRLCQAVENAMRDGGSMSPATGGGYFAQPKRQHQ